MNGYDLNFKDLTFIFSKKQKQTNMQSRMLTNDVIQCHTDPPNPDKVNTALMQLQQGETSGKNDIPPELFKEAAAKQLRCG